MQLAAFSAAVCTFSIQTLPRVSVLSFKEGSGNQTTLNGIAIVYFVPIPLRGVKDWVHRKTAKIIHDFNSFCNLDMNQKLVSVMIIKISYLCTLHNEIISPAHLCCLHVVAVNAHLLQH